MAAMLSAPEIQQDVDKYNERYGEMDRVLWFLARCARRDLLSGQNTPVVVALVDTIRDWWAVQHAREDAPAVTARALARLPWSEELLDDQFDAAGERFAIERVEQLEREMLAGGVGRHELSLASKVLHWLMPWRIPASDSYVRNALGIAEPADVDAALGAYREIVRHEFRASRQHVNADPRWTGLIDPKAPIRALDRCLWWRGGGSLGTARVEPDPWKVIRTLGLEPR